MYSIEYSVPYNLHPTFLGAFAKLWKETISFAMCPRLSAHMGYFGSYWTDLYEYFSKICRENSSFITV